ncbi:MAG: hypothetical protein HND52_19940 [Ignavibacteriae bacterium]|nr:hypothetical protein [Ignavibacteriota bacterium]NOH00241.1 hypothetical protein [Ignavibacteriota bacterium]
MKISSVKFNRKILFTLNTLFLLLICSNALPQNYKKAAPYSKIIWGKEEVSEYPQVLIDTTWYLLLGINDIPTIEIITFCNGKYGVDAVKRFNEDLVEVLTLMGYPPGDYVKLLLADIVTKENITLFDVEMTYKNRQAILQSELDKEKNIEKSAPEYLTFEEAKEDLQYFQVRLEKQFAYLKANNFDYKNAVKLLEEKCKSGISVQQFAWELQKIMAQFIDCHASISPRTQIKGYLPFSISSIGTRRAAYQNDRSAFLYEGFPYLIKIDDIDIQNWLNYADDFRAAGSNQYRTYYALKMLKNINHVRSEFGFPLKDSVKVELLSADFTRTITLSFPILTEKPETRNISFSKSKIMEGNIGYLRLATFLTGGGAVEDVEEWMPKFKNTNGLIIDVRNNGGGSRAALISLSKYLLSADDKPSIANVCAYRLFEDFRQDHLAARYAYKIDDERWSEKERNTINEFAESFIPQWQPNKNEFSDWHYVVLSKNKNDTQYHYDKPIIVLLDGGCFSATDIFLGALKNMRRNIKLLGTPSGGGSARSMRFMLNNSKLKVRNASMVSYQRTGALYDTNGIQPDFLVYPEPEYYLEGGRDNVLQKALEILN